MIIVALLTMLAGPPTTGQGDSTPPTAIGQSPPPGATVVSQGINVTAIFSEPIQLATLSMVLRNSSNQALDAGVSYDPDTRTARLDPDDELAGSQTFTATVSGARDSAGNLMAPVSWSFTTGTEGFQDVTLPQTGLVNPTVIEFAADGRVFVAEKSGRIRVYDNLDDSSPTTVADLSVNVYNFWDRGLLGMALHPNFPTTPYLYVLYTYDAFPGGGAPQWGGGADESCADATGFGCVVTGRLTRLDLSNPGDWPLSPADEAPLITDWYQQFPSHSVGSLAFGDDGALYVSGGEGANFDFTDFGQVPATPGAGDPVNEGGALRSQDLQTAGDPVTLDGTIIRIDPDTGAALPDNPGFSSSDPNARRILAYGLRNPFRMVFRPGTGEVWVGDVGWSTWEEINRLVDPLAAPVENFGWPCYEGVERQSGYDANDLPICEDLYSAGSSAVVEPHYTYHHGAQVVPGEACSMGSSSVSGLAFYPTSGGTYPSAYHGALFFADYSRNCIWAMRAGGDGLPDPDDIVTIEAEGGGPVSLVIGPGDDIFYPGFDDGRLHRIQHFDGNLPPTAVAQADPTSGLAPLVVSFDGTGSSDPEGQPLTYAWDLDADGSFDDSSSPTPQWTYTVGGTVIARLRVTDGGGLFDVAAVSISVNNSAPTAIIDTPAGSLTWKVGDPIAFTGRGIDADEPSGLLPPTALHWDLVMHHCPSNCHTHLMQSFAGVAAGSFAAPDHEYPSFLELRLSVTDPEGVPSTASVLLHPQTVALTLQSDPPGLSLAMNAVNLPTPFTRTVIIGSANSVAASSPQQLGGLPRQFSSWSDGGAQNHIVVAPATPATYTASFVVPPVPAEVCGDGLDNDGDGVVDGGCGAGAATVPGAPVRLTSRVQGANVTLAWSAPITGGPPTTYVLEAGLAPGQAAIQVPLGLLTSVSVPNVGPGKYFARVRAMNAAGASEVSNEVAATVGCTTRPGPPTLSSAVNGGLVRLTWTDPDGCSDTTYRLLAGSQPGAADLGELAVSDTVFTTPAPPGTYYLRVVAQTVFGSSDPSNEVALAVGSGCAPPTLDSILGATLTGNQVTLRWNPVSPPAALAADAAWPMAYRLEVGSSAGAANLLVSPPGRTTAISAAVPAGVYYARVRATDACGAGPPSNDVVISVP